MSHFRGTALVCVEDCFIFITCFARAKHKGNIKLNQYNSLFNTTPFLSHCNILLSFTLQTLALSGLIGLSSLHCTPI